MALSMGTSSSWAIGGLSGRSGRGLLKGRGGGAGRVRCAAVAGGSLRDQYRVLRLQPGASEKDVKTAFRQLALQYHPDVCKDKDCSGQFHLIIEAYDVILDNLRQPEHEEEQWQSQGGGQEVYDDDDDEFRGLCDSSWDLWEEWMGWEGAGIRDYSSHVNPYI